MSFVFILPVIHPESSKVSNYQHVEIILKRTIESLQKQTSSDIEIIIVCCKIPAWEKEIDNNVHFLDVSGSHVFKPDRNIARVDMGLKFIIGILYAFNKFKADMIMRVDGDDYVNSRLAEYSIRSLNKQLKSPTVDGYIIDKGLQVEVSVDTTEAIQYGKTYVVRRFNASCGTCRIFKEESLHEKLSEIHPDIFEKASHWLSLHEERSFLLPPEMMIWLDEVSKEKYTEEWHPVNILGRHVKQSEYLNFANFPFLGATKACGHGNHDGPREGMIHEDKILGIISTKVLEFTFGIKHTSETLRDVLNFYLITLFRVKLLMYFFRTAFNKVSSALAFSKIPRRIN